MLSANQPSNVDAKIVKANCTVRALQVFKRNAIAHVFGVFEGTLTVFCPLAGGTVSKEMGPICPDHRGLAEVSTLECLSLRSCCFSVLTLKGPCTPHLVLSNVFRIN